MAAVAAYEASHWPAPQGDPWFLATSDVLELKEGDTSDLHRAVADRRLPVDPAQGVPLPRKVKKTDRHYLTHQQVDLLADEAKAMAPLVRLLAYTGLRWGDAVALRVGDVDLVRSRVHV